VPGKVKQTPMKLGLRLAATVVGATLLTAGVSSQRAAFEGQWRHYGGSPGSTNYSALDLVNRDNVANLRIAWRWASPDNAVAASNKALMPGAYEDTPLMSNGVLYTITGLGRVAAIDPATGATIWQYDPETYKSGRPANLGFVHRGLAFWTDGKIERLLAGTHDAYLISVDARNGQPDPAFGNGGRVDLVEGLPYAQRVRNYTVTSAPVVARNVIVTGASISDGPQNMEAPRGDVSGYDVRTGKRLWTFRAVPARGEFGHDSWLEGSAEYIGNTNVWSLMSVDETLGLPIVKPPYSRLTAYDLNRGVIGWQIPLGDGPRRHPLLAHLDLPPLGGGRGWVLATRALLFVGHRGGRAAGQPPALLAIDKMTGQVIAKHELSLGPSAPMTYLHQNRQYVAMATGGGDRAEIVAFTLK